jgi:hypothetical protein
LKGRGSTTRKVDIWGDIFLVKPEKPNQIKVLSDYVGAGERNRTPDLLITNQLLYQLSYAGVHDLRSSAIIPEPAPGNNPPQQVMTAVSRSRPR